MKKIFLYIILILLLIPISSFSGSTFTVLQKEDSIHFVNGTRKVWKISQDNSGRAFIHTQLASQVLLFKDRGATTFSIESTPITTNTSNVYNQVFSFGDSTFLWWNNNGVGDAQAVRLKKYVGLTPGLIDTMLNNGSYGGQKNDPPALRLLNDSLMLFFHADSINAGGADTFLVVVTNGPLSQTSTYAHTLAFEMPSGFFTTVGGIIPMDFGNLKGFLAYSTASDDALWIDRTHSDTLSTALTGATGLGASTSEPRAMIFPIVDSFFGVTYQSTDSVALKVYHLSNIGAGAGTVVQDYYHLIASSADMPTPNTTSSSAGYLTNFSEQKGIQIKGVDSFVVIHKEFANQARFDSVKIMATWFVNKGQTMRTKQTMFTTEENQRVFRLLTPMSVPKINDTVAISLMYIDSITGGAVDTANLAEMKFFPSSAAPQPTPRKNLRSSLVRSSKS